MIRAWIQAFEGDNVSDVCLVVVETATELKGRGMGEICCRRRIAERKKVLLGSESKIWSERWTSLPGKDWDVDILCASRQNLSSSSSGIFKSQFKTYLLSKARIAAPNP